MPHLHLPTDHTDADLVLAANVADVVGSEDLYVAWSHETGAGAVPEVEAVMREERAPLGLLASLAAVIAALWNAITRRPPGAAAVPAGPLDRPRQGEPSA
jgi:hypothetical protein